MAVHMQHSEIVHFISSCTEGINVHENVASWMSHLDVKTIRLFFPLHLLRYVHEKNWHEKGAVVGDSSFYSSFDFLGFMYIEMSKYS